MLSKGSKINILMQQNGQSFRYIEHSMTYSYISLNRM